MILRNHSFRLIVFSCSNTEYVVFMKVFIHVYGWYKNFVFLLLVLVDLTEPESGEVIDGKEATFTDLQFTTNQAKVELQWRNFQDPESLIKQYEVLVESAK